MTFTKDSVNREKNNTADRSWTRTTNYLHHSYSPTKRCIKAHMQLTSVQSTSQVAMKALPSPVCEVLEYYLQTFQAEVGHNLI